MRTGGVQGDRRVGEMVLGIGELHGPREPSGWSWSVRDVAYVRLVGLVRTVRQKLQGLQFGTSEAFADQPPADGGAALGQVVEQGHGAGVWRDGGRDPFDVLDHAVAEAVALTFMVSAGDSVRDRGFHGPSFNFSCTSIWWRRRSS